MRARGALGRRSRPVTSATKSAAVPFSRFGPNDSARGRPATRHVPTSTFRENKTAGPHVLEIVRLRNLTAVSRDEKWRFRVGLVGESLHAAHHSSDDSTIQRRGDILPALRHARDAASVMRGGRIRIPPLELPVKFAFEAHDFRVREPVVQVER